MNLMMLIMRVSLLNEARMPIMELWSQRFARTWKQFLLFTVTYFHLGYGKGGIASNLTGCLEGELESLIDYLFPCISIISSTGATSSDVHCIICPFGLPSSSAVLKYWYPRRGRKIDVRINSGHECWLNWHEICKEYELGNTYNGVEASNKPQNGFNSSLWLPLWPPTETRSNDILFKIWTGCCILQSSEKA